MSYSDDNGANWHYQTANYFGDNGNQYNANSTAFIDPELTTDGENVWMMTTLFPGGIKISSAGSDSAFNSDGTLRISNNSGSSFDYKVNINSFTNGYSNIVNSSGSTTGYKIDKYYNLYDGSNNKVGNIFYNQSDVPYSVYRTTYLYLTKSTDGGETWGEPKLLNMKSSNEPFYGVAPGKGVVTSDGTIIMSTYKWNGSNESQQSSFIYSKDGGETWKKGGYLTTTSSVSTFSSENQLVVLDNNTIRCIFRNSANKVCYADLTKSGDSYSWGTMKTTTVTNNGNCMISAELYPKTINGKRILLVSCPTNTSDRKDGKIISFLLDDSNAMTSYHSYSIDSATEFNSSTNYYAYSCLSNTKDGKIALVYESNNATDISYKVLDSKTVLGKEPDFLPQKSTGVITHSGDRYNGKYQVVNDGESDNFSVAFWQYDISKTNGKHVKDAKLSVNVETISSTHSPQGLDFYSTTYSQALTSGANTTLCSDFGSNGITAVKTNMGCESQPDKHYASNELSGKTLTVDVTDGINRAVDAGQSTYTLIALQPSANTLNSGRTNWSDVNLTQNSQYLTGTLGNEEILSTSSTGVLVPTGNENRYKDNYYIICNDVGNNDNFSVAYWQYDLTALKNKDVSNVNFSIACGPVYGYNTGLSFYSTTYNQPLTSGVNGTICSVDNSVGNSDKNACVNAVKTNIGCSETSDATFTKEQLQQNENKAITVDITNGVNKALKAGNQYYTLIAMLPEGAVNCSGSNWSTCRLKQNTNSFVYTATTKPDISTNYTNAKKALDSFSVSQGNGKVSFHGTAINNATDGSNYNNVIYHNGEFTDGSYTNFAGPNNIKNNSSRISYPKQIVLLYDGKNDTSFPIRWQYKNVNNNWSFRFFYVSCKTNGLKLNDYWYGYNTIENTWLYGNSGYVTPNVGRISSTQTSSSYGYASMGSNTYNYNNLLHFDASKVSFNSDNYYVFNNGIQCYAEMCDTSGSGNDSSHATATVTDKNGSVYVINVKALYDYAQSQKTKLNSIDTSLYTVESINKYCDAIIALKNFNANSYNYSSNTATGVQTCTTAMKSLMTACDTAYNQLTLIPTEHTIKFIKADGTEQTAKYDDNTPASEVQKPANTEDKFNTESVNGANATYTTYGWDKEVTDVTADATYTEVSTVKDCVNVTGVYTKHVPKDKTTGAVGTKGFTTYTEADHGFTWTVVSNLDWSTYDAAIELCNSTIDSTEYVSQYTKESRIKFEKEFKESIIDEDNTLTQKNIDDAISKFDTAISKLQDVPAIQTYDVTFNVQIDGNDSQVETKTLNYGDAYTATVNSNLLDANSIVKWTIETKDGSTTSINTTESAIQTIVTNNITITCYLTKNPDPTEEETTPTTKVTLLDKSNNVTAIGYVENETVLDITGATVGKIGSAKDYAFYTFGGWKVVSGNVASADGKDIVLKAQYTFVEGDNEENYAYINGLDGVKINGTDKYKAKYDQIVSLTGSSKDAKFAFTTADGTVISYIATNYIHAPHEANVYVAEVAEETMEASTTITGTFVKDVAGSTKKSVSFNCQKFVPDNATFVECGAIIAVYEKYATDETDKFTKEQSNVVAAKSESQSVVGEYTMTFTANFGKNTKAFGRSYVTYKDSEGKLHTVYSAVSTVSLAL